MTTDRWTPSGPGIPIVPGTTVDAGEYLLGVTEDGHSFVYPATVERFPRCGDCGSTDLHEGPDDPPPWCCCKRCGSTNIVYGGPGDD